MLKPGQTIAEAFEYIYIISYFCEKGLFPFIQYLSNSQKKKEIMINLVYLVYLVKMQKLFIYYIITLCSSVSQYFTVKFIYF